MSLISCIVFPLLGSSSGNMSVLNDTQAVTMYCNIEADPVADIVWFFNGQLLTNGGKYTFNEMGTQLVISLITYSDMGAYFCEASNVFGAINSTVWLNVQGNIALYCPLYNVDVVFVSFINSLIIVHNTLEK